MMPRPFIFGLATTVVIWASGPESQAALIGVTPMSGLPGQIVPAPSSVLDDGLSSSDAQLGFDEVQGFTLMRDITTDQGVIPAGTIVDSHMILLNPVSESTALEAVNDWLFSGVILGTMSDSDGTLEAAASDLLGLGTIVYPDGGFPGRGMELPDTPIIVSPAALRVGMQFTGESGDWIRVVTASSVPEPSALALMGVGLVCLLRARHLERKFFRRPHAWY